MTPAELAAFNSASWVQMAIVPAALNVVWVAIYYLLVRLLGSCCACWAPVLPFFGRDGWMSCWPPVACLFRVCLLGPAQPALLAT